MPDPCAQYTTTRLCPSTPLPAYNNILTDDRGRCHEQVPLYLKGRVIVCAAALDSAVDYQLVGRQGEDIGLLHCAVVVGSQPGTCPPKPHNDEKGISLLALAPKPDLICKTGTLDHALSDGCRLMKPAGWCSDCLAFMMLGRHMVSYRNLNCPFKTAGDGCRFQPSLD